MTPAILDHSPHETPDFVSNIFWLFVQGFITDLWMIWVPFVGVFLLAAIWIEHRRGKRRKGDE